MKSNKKSIHAKLYKFTYDSCLSDNVCIYFWKLFFSIIVLIPNCFLKIITYFFPNKIIWFLFKEDKYSYNNFEKRLFGFICLAFIIIIALNYNLVKAALNFYSYSCYFANLSIFLDSVVAIITLCVLINSLINSKYCKKIEWEEPN